MIGNARGGESPGVLFRCDGSLSIGMGHVVRCSALALELKKFQCDVRFAMRELPGSAVDFVRKTGFPVEIIDSASEESVSLTETDCVSTVNSAHRSKARCVVVDHYAATSDYLKTLKDEGMRVAVIDDLADRDLTSADWLLNQSLDAAGLAYRARPDCVRLLGPSYALLRPEFGLMRRHLSRKFGPEDRRVLLTLGGGEETAVFGPKILEALNRMDRPLEVRCALLGDSTSASLTQAAAASRHEVEILRNVGNMAEQMAWADLSINGGGSTCWELCCLGVPMVVLVVAPDQAPTAAELERRGCAVNLGLWNGENRARLADVVGNLLADPGKREAMSRRAQALVDGSGAERAANLFLLSMA